jgi:thiol-disulfide isomerase/thioredoxin
MTSFLFWFSYAALWVVVITIACATLLLYRYQGFQFLATTPEGRKMQGPGVGKPLSRFTAHVLDSPDVEVGITGADAQVLVFAAAGCRPCQAVMPPFGAFADEYGSRVDAIVVYRGSESDARTATRDMTRKVRVVPDETGEVHSRFRIINTPFVVVVDRFGVVRESGYPTRANNYFESLLDIAAN